MPAELRRSCLTVGQVELGFEYESDCICESKQNGRRMAWLIYWPLLLVVAAAVAAGIAILVRKLRHKNDNPFIVKR